MPTTDTLNTELLKCEESNYNGNFVAAAVQIIDGLAKHAGILVNCEEGVFLCHYTSTEILIEEPPIEDNWFFYKMFTFIDSRLCSTILGLCKSVKETSHPHYGPYYEGSFYALGGVYYSNVVQQEFMTCVGFCLNIIKGVISEEEEQEFFVYTDWSHVEVNEGYLNRFVDQLRIHNPGISINDLKENIRRIKPSDYLASAYLPNFPIHRAQIAEFIDDLLAVIALKNPPIEEAIAAE